MINILIVAFANIFFSVHCYAFHFAYPVAACCTENGPELLMLYQKNLGHIELCQYNPATQKSDKLLPNHYIPAGLRLLPDNQGFSFIDNGRIKIKMFNKRSPKSLDIYEPLYNIQVLHWIDNQHCYFSATHAERVGIYDLSSSGQLHMLLGHCRYDYLYPQKVHDQLFYIKRYAKDDKTARYNYSICVSDYPKIPMAEASFNDDENNESYKERVKKLLESPSFVANKALLNEDTSVTVIDYGCASIAFLTMIDSDEGFVLEHERVIDKDDKTMTFQYHHIKKENNTWKTECIFSFELPTLFFMGADSERLYESILPLLPKIYGKTIYFMDCSYSKPSYFVDIFAYALSHNTIKQITHSSSKRQHAFAPCIINNTLFYGGSIDATYASDEQEMPPMQSVSL